MDNKTLQAEEQLEAHVDASIFKPPTFLEDNTDLWIDVLEISFRMARIVSDQAKFGHLVMSLPEHLLLVIRQIISHPQESNRYELAKKIILKCARLSDNVRIQRLFQGLTMSARKPSALLQEMRQLTERKGFPITLLK